MSWAATRQAQVRAQLIKQFREEVRPIAEQVAKDKGASVVLLTNDNVLWYDPTVDITDGVIAQIITAGDSERAVFGGPDLPDI